MKIITQRRIHNMRRRQYTRPILRRQNKNTAPNDIAAIRNPNAIRIIPKNTDDILKKQTRH